MPKLSVILAGEHRTRKMALSIMAEKGEVDESTLTSEYMPGVDIDGTFHEVPATRYTAEVEPNEANREAAYGCPQTDE